MVGGLDVRLLRLGAQDVEGVVDHSMLHVTIAHGGGRQGRGRVDLRRYERGA